MKNLIPKAIAYAQNRGTTENHDFQRWLQDTIDREDLIAWARRDDTQRITGVITPSHLYEPDKKVSFFRRFISPLIA